MIPFPPIENSIVAGCLELHLIISLFDNQQTTPIIGRGRLHLPIPENPNKVWSW